MQMNKINIKDLTTKDIGRFVKYIPFLEMGKPEDNQYGRITSFNDVRVFVDYGCGRGIPTIPRDLRFSNS